MTKKELLAAIAKKAGVPADAAAKVYEATVAVVVDEIVNGGIRVDGVGTFKVVNKAARVSKNPKTGETINVPAKKVVKFKPANALADAVK